MTEIDYIEDKESYNEPLVSFSPELLDRYLLNYSPEIHHGILRGLYDIAIKKLALGTKKQLPEINVNNALIILHDLRYSFVVGIDAKYPEEHRISVPFPLSIESVKDSQVEYVSGWPRGTLVRPLYVKITSPVTKEFSLKEMSMEESSELWSWAVGRMSEPIITKTVEWITWEKDKGSPPSIPAVKDTLLVSLAKELEEKTGRSFMVSMSIFYSNMIIAGYSEFVDAVLMGKDYSAEMSALEHKIATIDAKNMNEARLVEEKRQKSVFIYHASMRLNTDKYAKFLQEIEMSMTMDKIKSKLKPQEVKIIEDSIIDEEKKTKAMTNNPCPHRKLIRKLETSNNADEKKEILTSIKEEYLPDDYTNNYVDASYISCKKCNYPLICPHNFLMQVGLSERKQLKEIKESINGFIYPDKIKGNYVCRICGQNIISLSAFDTVVDQYSSRGMSDDPEVSMLWSEVSFMTKYVTFENLVNKNMFVTSVVSLIWPLIETQVNKILSSKGSSAEELLAKKRINSAVYILAAFINLSLTSKASSDKNVVKVSLDYPSDTKGENEMRKMFNYAAFIIMDTLKVHIRKVSGMNDKVIANELIRAYAAINEKKKGPIAQVYDSSGSTDTWLNNSWLYYLAAHMLPIVNEASILKLLDTVAPFVTPEAKQSDSKKSKKVSKKIIPVRQEAPIKTPKWNLSIEPMSPNEILKKYVPKLEHYTSSAENKLMNEFLRQWNKYYDMSFTVTVDIMKNIYPSIGYIGAEENAAMAGLRKHRERRILHAYENLMLRIFRYSNMRNVDPLPSKNRYYIRHNSPLGLIYNDNGERRVWKNFGPWKKTGAKSWVKSEGNVPMIWKDISGYSYGDPIIDDDKIYEAIKEREKVGNMIQFYEFICPMGDSHTFNKKTCSKCGYTQEVSGADYYKKYLSEYKRDLEMISGGLPQIPPAEKIVIQKKPVTIKSIDHAMTIEAAKFCRVSTATLEAIGAYESVPMKQISEDKYTAPVTTDKLANRPDKIRACCLQLITRYGAFVNIGNNYNPPKELIDLMVDTPVPKGIMTVEEFAENFMEEYDTVFYNNGAKDLVEFALGSFIKMILKLKTISETYKGIEPIIEWVIDGPLRSERLGTVPVITNWSAILKSLKETTDSNTDDTSGPIKEVDEDTLDGDGLDLEDVEDSEDASNQIKLKGE